MIPSIYVATPEHSVCVLAGDTAGTAEPSGRAEREGPEEKGPRPTFHHWQHGEPITWLAEEAVPVFYSILDSEIAVDLETG